MGGGGGAYGRWMDGATRVLHGECWVGVDAAHWVVLADAQSGLYGWRRLVSVITNEERGMLLCSYDLGCERAGR